MCRRAVRAKASRFHALNAIQESHNCRQAASSGARRRYAPTLSVLASTIMGHSEYVVRVNGQPKMDINGHEKSPQTANSQEVKARSFSKLIGMSNQYNFEGASKLDESGDCRENP